MQEKYNWENKIIVVADDDDLNTELIKLMLRRTNANVILLNDGQEVINYVQNPNNTTDIILIDIQMPVMSGIDAAIIIRDSELNIPIIALTALNNIKNSEGYEESLFDKVLEKPVNRAELLTIIDGFFNS